MEKQEVYPLFQELSAEELEALRPYFRRVSFDKGDWIIREGETGEGLFLLGGSAEIIKRDSQLLGVLEAGEWVGEMNHFEGSERSASVRALEQFEALVLNLREIQGVPELRVVYSKLIGSLSDRLSRRLKAGAERLIESLKETLQVLYTHAEVGRSIIAMFLFLALYFTVAKITQTYSNWNETQELNGILVPAFLVILGVGITWILGTSRHPPSYFGLSWKGGWRYSLEAILITVAVFPFSFLFEWAAIRYLPPLKGLSLYNSVAKEPILGTVITWSIYLALVPVQELVTRGILQTYLKNFLSGRFHVFFAILSANLLFEVVHLMKGASFGIVASLHGILWGYIYERQGTLVGPCVSHMITGVWLLLFLNYETAGSLLP